MKDIVKLTERISKDENRLNDIAEIVYKKCLQDREFAKTGAVLCDRLTNNTESGGNFRTALLKLVQVDFKGILQKSFMFSNACIIILIYNGYVTLREWSYGQDSITYISRQPFLGWWRKPEYPEKCLLGQVKT